MFNILKIYITFTMIYFFARKNKINKIEKILAKPHIKEEYVIHITSLKQALNHGLVLKKFNLIKKFTQKRYIDMNTESKKKYAKTDCEKDFLS